MPAEKRRDLLDRLDKLYPAVVSDVMDKIGIRQNAMSPDIRPLWTAARTVGFAFPVLATEVYTVPAERADWYKLELEAVDHLSDGDVMVVSHVDGSFWGELLSTAAQARGARGIVIDGYTRDTLTIMEMQFPVFMRGISMADSLGRMEVLAYNVPIVSGGVQVEPGDMVIADYDGILIVPGAQAEEIIIKAEEKLRGENMVRKHLQDGMLVSEAFRRFGII